VARDEVEDALGRAVLELLARAWSKIRPVVSELAHDFIELARPHPPIFLVTLQGDVLTGIAVMEGGRVLAFIGTRSPAPAPRYGRHDPYDEPLWSHER